MVFMVKMFSEISFKIIYFWVCILGYFCNGGVVWKFLLYCLYVNLLEVEWSIEVIIIFVVIFVLRYKDKEICFLFRFCD